WRIIRDIGFIPRIVLLPTTVFVIGITLGVGQVTLVASTGFVGLRWRQRVWFGFATSSAVPRIKSGPAPRMSLKSPCSQLALGAVLNAVFERVSRVPSYEKKKKVLSRPEVKMGPPSPKLGKGIGPPIVPPN